MLVDQSRIVSLRINISLMPILHATHQMAFIISTFTVELRFSSFPINSINNNKL